MPLLKRHSRPTRDLHNTAKQCQCANCSADADTPHQARHHNVPVYLSFFLHLPFILFPFLLFLSILFLPVTARFSNYHFHCSFLSPIMKSAPSTRAKDNMHADDSDIQIPSNDENSDNTKTLQCKPRNTLPHTMPVNITRTYMNDVINRTYNQ